ncbi:hypothetical protein CAPTEDRAFT_185473 [Capitella teleta]|uniref:Uncharacterized protein n=1 Tax=Capitella teleta TaxID=283909 RepID=R7VJG9_CAPTE|nr:hypothetical protein CAPTEDRAFT_185473 [Capitella teleta]|eukprot:ELU16511.1 hypothetical protein CAPTEDRAFT_185473 [Capitella teleta]
MAGERSGNIGKEFTLSIDGLSESCLQRLEIDFKAVSRAPYTELGIGICRIHFQYPHLRGDLWSMEGGSISCIRIMLSSADHTICYEDHTAPSPKVSVSSQGKTLKLLLAFFAIWFIFSLNVSFTVSKSTIPDRSNATQPQTDPQLPVCSTDFLRQFVTDHHRYPDFIQWSPDYNSFSPVTNCRVIPQNISLCLSRKKVDKIVVYGDSQGGRYTNGLINIIKQTTGMSCDVTKRENRDASKTIDLDYFAAGNKTLRSSMTVGQAFGCTGCSGFQAQCKYGKSNLTLDIEYISVEHVTRSYLFLNESSEADTFEKFIFNVYLKKSFPDLSVFFMPMNHIKQKPMEAFVRDFPRTLLPVVKKAKPQKSDFFFIPGTAEFEETRRSQQHKYALWNGFLAVESIRQLNAELFKLLEKEILKKSSKIYSFLDLVDVTLPIPHLSVDGVHFTGQWYSAFWSVFLNVYCENN